MATISISGKRSKGLQIALWVIQVLLAVSFLMAGVMKTLTPVAELQKNMAWTGDIPEWLLRFIGLSEFAAGLGFILPSLLKIRPQLTVYAGFGIALIMLFASGFHIARGEYEAVSMNIILGALALFVGWGRGRRAKIMSRNSPG